MSLQSAAALRIEGSSDRPDLSSVVRIIRQHRQRIADALFQTSEIVLAPTDDAPRQKIASELELLENYLLGRVEFGDFLLGDKARCLRELDPRGGLPDSELRLKKERVAILRATEGLLNREETLTLESHLKTLHQPLTLPSTRRLDILFVGDCLGRELQCFLYPACKRMGIDLHLTHLGGKTEFLVKTAVEASPHAEYDLVFYSPFTHESVPEYSGISRKPFLSDDAIKEVAESAAARAIAITEWLRERFPNPPLFVHDSSFLVREISEDTDSPVFKKAKQRLGELLSRRVRERARNTVNTRIREYVSKQPGSRRLHLLEEYQLTQTAGEDNLRKFMMYGDDVHPTVLGVKLAELYGHIIAAHSLQKKKVFVSDLDNTLWEGVIGEGSVVHFAERQRILRRLREKGFVLAVCSKNDAANVKWTDSILQEQDFVATRINWTPKTENLRSIATELNLGVKEFVFVDDMPSERALVQQELPDVTVMDSGEPATWLVLGYVASMANGDETDRTRLYHERKHREEFLQSQSSDLANHRAALKSLDLFARIGPVTGKNASRVAELVNRTNQFNINGARVTEAQVHSRIGDAERPILCVDVKDRFGENGLVSCALLSANGDEFEIDALVLSCRVFGFGIETALVNAVKRLAHARGARRVVARFISTERNRPCQSFLPDHQFEPQGAVWQCDRLVDCVDPDWLSVERHV